MRSLFRFLSSNEDNEKQMVKFLSVLLDAKLFGCLPKKREKEEEKTVRLLTYLEPFSPFLQLNQFSFECIAEYLEGILHFCHYLLLQFSSH